MWLNLLLKFSEIIKLNKLSIMRRTGLILLLMILSSAFCAEAKSTMELLINKEWYEIDIKQFQIHENYYIKYTGTQRMTVGSDE